MNGETLEITGCQFITSVSAGAAALGATATLGSPESIAERADSGPMPRRSLGQTGWTASIFSLGGQTALDRKGHGEEAVAIINHALDLGVDYLDTAELYGGGFEQLSTEEMAAIENV